MIYCNYPGIISAGMVELADTMDLGSIGQPCRFKSCYPHHKSAVILIELRRTFCHLAKCFIK